MAFAHFTLWISHRLSTGEVQRDPRFLQNWLSLSPAAFFENPRSLVYTQEGIYKIVVVVNAGVFLWISLFTWKKSGAYALYKPVNESVLQRWQFWTILRAVYKELFVHKPYLWICRSLSTGGCYAMDFWRFTILPSRRRDVTPLSTTGLASTACTGLQWTRVYKNSSSS